MYIANNLIVHNGKEYTKGQEVPVSDKDAKELLADRAVVLVGDTKSTARSKSKIADTEVNDLKIKLAEAEARAKAAEDLTTLTQGGFDDAKKQVVELTAKLAEAEAKIAELEKR